MDFELKGSDNTLKDFFPLLTLISRWQNKEVS